MKLLNSGLVLVETRLDWTLMEKTDVIETLDSTNSVMKPKSNSEKYSDLSFLITIAFRDLSESGNEHDKANEEHFTRSIKVDVDESYEVCFPWIQKPSILNILLKCRSTNTKKMLQFAEENGNIRII